MKNLIRPLLFGMLLLAACAAPAVPVLPGTPATAPTLRATLAPISSSTPSPVPPTVTPSEIPGTPTTAPSPTAETPTPASSGLTSTLSVVNANTLNGKVIFGYQGWFSCPNDGSKLGAWFHWTKRSKTFTAADITVDNWPDVTELAADERCPTGMKMPNGTIAEVFSSYNLKTVDRHFQWMQQYGIDGVAVQRFVTGLDDARNFDFRNHVLQNVRASAEAHGRVFYVEYDATGKDAATLVASLQKDWTYLVDDLKVTESPQYLRDHGLPVLEIYGLGFTSHAEFTAELAQQIVDYAKTSAPAKYRVTLIGGVPSYWRTGTHDSFAGPAWASVYRSFDVISPWAVGRYKDDKGADKYQQDILSPDLAETAKGEARYMPVVFPGFSWTNLNQGPLNDIPRRCGAFYWHQVYNAISAGSGMMFVAMFDEVDEGTAMFKLAPTQDQLPVGAKMLPLNADGCSLSSDWYLRLGGATGQMLRGEINLTPEFPIKPK